MSAVILFTRNYGHLQQLRQLTQSIREMNPQLLIMTDQEGGRVQRFQTSFTRLPSMRTWSEAYQTHPGATTLDLDRTIALMVHELREVGVDMALMPVLDLDYNLNTVIGDRSLGKTAEAVTTLADLILRSLKRYRMPSTGKHFPGHGAVKLDSHTHLPVDERPLGEIAATDMLPYRCLAHHLDSIMTAHILYPSVDALPASFSARWLKQILRETLRFKGVIISDCLSMEAVSAYGDYPTRAQLALQAGCDLITVCNNRSGVIKILDNTRHICDLESQNRIRNMKNACYLFTNATI